MDDMYVKPGKSYRRLTQHNSECGQLNCASASVLLGQGLLRDVRFVNRTSL